MKYADTLAHYVERHGHILPELADDYPEQAIFVRTLGWGCRAWQHEAEPEREPPVIVEPKHGQQQAAILAYLREHGESSALEMARALWQHGGLQVLRVRLCAMAQRGVLVRVTKGRYRLA